MNIIYTIELFVYNSGKTVIIYKNKDINKCYNFFDKYKNTFDTELTSLLLSHYKK